MIKYSVKKPLTIFVVMVIVITVGVMSILNMTPDLFPSIDLPYVVVMTTYPGATPAKVEETVTRPLERSLATVENLKKIQSMSGENMSMVMLEFESETDMDTAVVNILQKTDIVKSSWDEMISSPHLLKLNPSMIPVSVAAVDMEGATTEEVSSFVKDTLLNELEGTTGIADIQTGGLIEAKVNVLISDEKIAKLNEKLLGEANPSLASAQGKLNEAKTALEKAEAELASKKEQLYAAKSQTYDKLSDAGAKLDIAVANSVNLNSQVTLLTQTKAAMENALKTAEEQGVPESVTEQIRAQIRNLETQLAQSGVSADAAKSMLTQMEKAYKEAQRGSYTAIDSFVDAQIQISEGQRRLSEEKAKLDDALKQLNNAGSQSLQAKGLGAFITIDMVSNILKGQNFDMPAGYIRQDGSRYLISVGDGLNELEQIQKLFLLNVEGLGDVFLDDVADVFMKDNKDLVYARINDNNGVVLSFFKQSNYTTVEASNNLKDKFEALSKKYENISFTNMMDQGEYIYLIIGSILESLAYGAVFAILILLLFLRDIKPTIVTLLSIPISMTFAVVLMYFSNISINLVSLSGLATAVGMLVDNSIVVIENIFRLRREGVSARRAAVAGAKEVTGAIVASTLTTVCVFSPIVFVQGITRQLFTDMALTLTYSLGASLLIAITLVPAMSSMMFTKEPKPEGVGFERFKAVYEKVLGWCLKVKIAPLSVALLLLVGSTVGALSKGFIFVPDMATPQLSGSMIMTDPKATLEETKNTADEVLRRIGAMEDVANAGGMLDAGGATGMSMGGGSMSGGSGSGSGSGEERGYSVSLYLIIDEDSKLSGKEIADKATELCNGLPCEVIINSSSSITSMTTALGGAGVVAEVYGLEQNKLQQAAETLGKAFETVEGIDTVNNGLAKATPEYHFKVDKKKAMEKGLTVAQVYMSVAKSLTYEKGAASMVIGGNQYDIMVQKGDESSINMDYLKALELEGKDMMGNTVRVTLGEVAEVVETQSLPTIRRNEQRTFISVSGTVKEGYNITLVTGAVKKAVEEVTLPEGITYEFHGENETIMEAIGDLGLMMALGVLLVYLVMVAQFQSLKSPFIVMFTIPLAVTGGLLAILIFGKELSALAMIGLILLVGVIVNNGIVLVDYTNQLRERGMAKKEAIIKAGSTRMRPVLMTSLTTILGLIVMAVGKTAGTDMMQPVALVSVGGLIYATALTLIIVPVMYDIFNGEEFKVVRNEDVDVSDILD